MDQVMRGRDFWRWVGWLRHLGALLGMLGMMAQQHQRPAPKAVSDYEVKAAFLLNFTKFVTWPEGAFEDSGSPLAICILGPDPFGPVMDQLAEGEEAGGRKVIVRRIERTPRAKACQVLYVGVPEKEVAGVLSDLGPGVLTVGQHAGFLNEGGIINFVIEERHVRFDINRSAAASAGLTISARLLSVARATR